MAEYVSPADIFTEYAYFSSFSTSWVEHARAYTETVRRRLKLTEKSFVIEIASNDGYLLQHFVTAGIPVLGIEPAANVAEAARRRHVPTRSCFFGTETARTLVAQGEQADLLIGNNVLAHVPDLNDFVAGMKIVLKPTGVITMEFPHLMRLMEGNQFDTIYHEHFSYFSFSRGRTGLRGARPDAVRRRGDSDARRLAADLRAARRRPVAAGRAPAVAELRAREERAGLKRLETYSAFDEQVKETKRKLLEFLIAAKREGKSVVGYGAPGKGNTLLNYCGIRIDFLDYTVDRNPVQARQVSARHPHPDLSAGTDPARPDPTTC